MKICDKCSVANNDTAVFCTGCGALLPNSSSADSENPIVSEASAQQNTEYAQPNAEYSQQNTAYAQPQSPFVQPIGSQPAMPQMPYGYAPINENMLPEDYKPVTVLQYIGYTILFGLPIIGIIMLFVTAFGSDKSISLRNYAKYNLIMYAIGIVMTVFVFLVAGMFSASLY